MIIDLLWFEGAVAGFGWGLLIGFLLGVRWFRDFVREMAGESEPPKKG